MHPTPVSEHYRERKEMTAISKSQRERLDLAMADIVIKNADYQTCANPDWITVTFTHPDVKEGYHMTGATFFDFRRRYAHALQIRGFRMEVDNQGGNPFSLCVRDTLPADLCDGEIVGLDNDGSLLQWNGDECTIYNCGQTPEEYGLENIDEKEMARITPALEARKHLARANEIMAQAAG